MMRRCIAIGLLCVWPVQGLALTPTISVYRTILDSTRRELVAAAPTENIRAFAEAVLRERGHIVQENDVLWALQGKRDQLCTTKDRQEGLDRVACEQHIEHIRTLVHDEEALRALGNSLQAIATSYELPSSALPGSIAEGPMEGGILEFWRTGRGAVDTTASGRALRVLRFPEAAEDGRDIAAALDALTEEERIAAVWHYLHGVKYVRGERTDTVPAPTADDPTLPENAPGTERQYLFKSQEAVEAALDNIFAALQAELGGIDPPLQANEVAVFAPPLSLGNDVIVWARSDDVGLQYDLPIETVLPSLLAGTTPILGGRFPPAPANADDATPQESQGLCSHPRLEDGYLCQPMTEKNVECLEEPEPDSDSLVLTSCTATTGSSATLSGPDICRDIEWRDGEFDPRYQCTVNIGCKDVCNDATGVPNPAVVGHTYEKKADGSVDVCVRSEAPIPQAYLAIMGLSAAHRVCGMEPFEKIAAPPTRPEALGICCNIMGFGARSMCEAMAEDGVLRGEPGDEPISVRDCIDAQVNFSCQTTCFREIADGVTGEIQRRAQANPANLPDMCTEGLDRRGQLLLEAAEKRDDICRAERPITFRSTIGNTLCHFGSCLEEALDMSRVTPGMVPMHTTDQTAPFESDTKRPPLVAMKVQQPLSVSGRLPAYRPAALAQAFDTALCQLNGLPATTPPALCAFDPSRRLSIPIDNLLPMADSLAAQPLSLSGPTAAMERLAAGMGAKIGAEMFARYLGTAARGLTDTINRTSELITEMGATEFPARMCTVGADSSSSRSR